MSRASQRPLGAQAAARSPIRQTQRSIHVSGPSRVTSTRPRPAPTWERRRATMSPGSRPRPAFTGPTTVTGTSGDTQAISLWKWTNQSVPDADEINSAYAAKYQSAARDELFVGMDRYAVNGSKDIGFWFFHEALTPKDDGTFSGAHCAPNQITNYCPGAPHGALLILTTFSAGGGTTTARAYEWVGS